MRSTILLIIVLCALCLSCTDVINVDLKEGPIHLVIEGGIELIKENPSGYQAIRLTTTAPFFSNQPTPAVSGAQVSVSASGRNYQFVESATIAGLYETDSLHAALNEVYLLQITWEGDLYEATENLTPVAAIDSIYQVFVEETVFDDEGIRVRIDYTDPDGEGDYYYWQQLINGDYYLYPNPGTVNDLLSSDEFYDGGTVIGKEPNSEINHVPGDTALVRQIGLSRRAFDYYTLLFEQTGGVGFVETPAVSIRGNIQNITTPDKYPLGYFRASEVSEAEIVIQ